MSAPSPTDPRGPALTVVGASKHYGRTRALDQVRFTVRRGTVHGLLGGNGSGKSTLIKILAGVVPADPGAVLQLADGSEHLLDLWTPADARRAGLRFVHQNPGIFPGMTVAENLALGRGFPRQRTGNIAWREHRSHAEAVLSRFAIDTSPDTEIGRLGPATRTMVAIARALQDLDGESGGVLVLDEPTASLPRGEVTLLLDAVRGYAAAGQTIVLVSHRLDEVLDVASEVSVLRDGRAVASQPCAGLTKRDLARLVVGHDVFAAAALTKPVRAVGTPALSVRGLAVGPLHDVDLDVPAGAVIGVAGLLGSGRTTLLRSIFGAVRPDAGTMQLAGEPLEVRSPRAAVRRGIAYVPEDRASSAAFANLSVRANLTVGQTGRYWRGVRFDHRRERAHAGDAVGRFHVKCASPDALITSLSGGNQQKAVLARWLRLEPRLLLLDEPTQGVDVGARAEIFGLVREAVAGGASVLMVSSDFEELIEVCDEIVVLSAGRVVETVPATGQVADRLLESALNGVQVA